jgi:hypothetical protein
MDSTSTSKEVLAKVFKIESLIRDFTNYYEEEKINFFTEGYNFVISKLSKEQEIEQSEYNFLSWLNFNDNVRFPVTINKPSIPEIIEIPLDVFVQTFCTNAIRKNLLYQLQVFLRDRNKLFNCKYTDVLIGGSFTDLNEFPPNDIDCAILLTKRDIHDFATYGDRISTVKELDLRFLNEEYCYRDYLAYVWIIMLGNDAKIKGKNAPHSMKNNSFKKRKVFKVRFILDKIVL